MYENYYGLKRKPFCLVPDPSFLFSSATYKRGIAYLGYGIEKGEGIIVVSGEAGTGKSFLMRSLLEGISADEVIVRMLMSPVLSADELVRAVLTCFGLDAACSKAEQLNRLEKYLLASADENKRVILAVDEAHCLNHGALEELRMLSNFQRGERALLQIFLLGQPALWETLNGADMVQFKQRIIAAHRMQPLTLDETPQYILCRLRHAGWSGEPAIDADVLALIHEHSEGNPRNINRLCDRILLQGFLEESRGIDRQLVFRAIDELRGELMEPPRPGVPLANISPKAQPSDDALHAPAELDQLFKKPEQKPAVVEVKVKVEPEPDVAVKAVGFQLSSHRPRTLAGLGYAGVVLVAVLIFLLAGDYLSPSTGYEQRPEIVLPESRPPEANPSNDILKSIDRSAELSTLSSRPSFEDMTLPYLQSESAESRVVEDKVVATSFGNDSVAGDVREQADDAVAVVTVTATPQAAPALTSSAAISVPLPEKEVVVSVASIASPEKSAATEPMIKKPALIVAAPERVAAKHASVLRVEKPEKIVPSVQTVPLKKNDVKEFEIVESSKAEMVAESKKNGDKEAFSQLISRFSSAYEMGDVNKLLTLFSQNASTPESKNRDAIIDEYEKLFSFTEARKVVFSDVKWAQEGDAYVGQGRFEATVKEKGHRKQRSYYGAVEFHLERRDEMPVITYVAHAYDE